MREGTQERMSAQMWFVLCTCVDSNVNVPNIARESDKAAGPWGRARDEIGERAGRMDDDEEEVIGPNEEGEGGRGRGEAGGSS